MHAISSRDWWLVPIYAHKNEDDLLAKTMRDYLPAIQQFLGENHSYDCPYLLVLPILEDNPDLLNWIKEETHPQESIG